MRLICGLVVLAAVGMAQETVRVERIFEKGVPGTPAVGDRVSVMFVAGELAEGKPLKGAPYSAETVNESVQVLADGNRIVHKSTGQVYRDSEGRLRREQQFEAVGPWSTEGPPMMSVTITDPVANVTYIVDPKAKQAHKLPAPQEGPRFFTEPMKAAQARAGSPGFAIMSDRRAGPEGAPKTESLGKKVIQGVVCEGTRSVITIPEGAEGNERPMEIVSERWFSPELQVVVMSKHKDPRIGETNYRLENLSRAEPSPSLFQVPSDYTVNTDLPADQLFEKKIRVRDSSRDE